MGFRMLLWLQEERQRLLREFVLYRKDEDLARLERVRKLIDRMLVKSLRKMENT